MTRSDNDDNRAMTMGNTDSTLSRSAHPTLESTSCHRHSVLTQHNSLKGIETDEELKGVLHELSDGQHKEYLFIGGCREGGDEWLYEGLVKAVPH